MGWRTRSNEMHLVVYSKPGCPLCDEGLELVEELALELSYSHEVRNILSDPAWYASYRHDVPVVVCEGRTIVTLRFTAEALRRGLLPERPSTP